MNGAVIEDSHKTHLARHTARYKRYRNRGVGWIPLTKTRRTRRIFFGFLRASVPPREIRLFDSSFKSLASVLSPLLVS
jgi:hypothetical protein